MYALRPIFDLPPCSPSKVMYKLPNILADKDDGSSHVEADIDAKMPDDVVTEQVIRLLQVSVSFPRAVPRCKQRYIVRSRAPVHARGARSRARQPRPRLCVRTRHDDSSRKFPPVLIRDRSRAVRRSDVSRFLSLSLSGLDRCVLPAPPLSIVFFERLKREVRRTSVENCDSNEKEVRRLKLRH